MRFKIDKRFTTIQLILAVVGYALGITILLFFSNMNNLPELIGITSVACVLLYFVSFYPRDIVIKDGILSFADKHHYTKLKIQVSDITQIDCKYKYYNTLTITTTSGDEYKLHPMDAEALKEKINSHSK